MERHGDLGVTAERLDLLIDTVVRLVLSHVMQPSASPQRTARDIAWVAGQLLG